MDVLIAAIVLLLAVGLFIAWLGRTSGALPKRTRRRSKWEGGSAVGGKDGGYVGGSDSDGGSGCGGGGGGGGGGGE
ncbi:MULTISPECIES: hypothetical protein [unclassified Nocardia]|uniref:hypothetical protein n=1 Tax=unclassified Nocardia TaxID=2637762 RepID=UPI00278C5F2E|nr:MULTISPECIES: hypothetical protein [unclassified Nocardia]